MIATVSSLAFLIRVNLSDQKLIFFKPKSPCLSGSLKNQDHGQF
jgi:hypothetical protein